MRMMMRVQVPTVTGSAAIEDGTLPRVVQATMERFHPEAAYFTAVEGLRTGYFFVDIADVSQIPTIVEPLFMELDAKVDLVPVMTADDLAKGLRQLAAG